MTYSPTAREQTMLREPFVLPGIGMANAEIKRYSLLRALNSLADPDHRKRDGLEHEASRETAKHLGRDPDLLDPHTLLIPPEILQRGMVVSRDLNTATTTEGGYLVDSPNISFIDLLRNRSMIYRLGATRLPGLRGDANIPKQTGAATHFWLADESTGITESQQTLGQLPLRPKTCGAYTEISRRLTLQSAPSAEGLVMRDLAAVVGLAVDAAAINGSGAGGEPEGLLTATGLHTASGTTLGYASILETQSDVLGSNALVNPGAVGYATTPAVAALLMNRVKFTSTASPLWEGAMLDGQMVGYRAMSSKQVPDATMIFGDFSQLVIAEWGALELGVNPFADFPAGVIGVRAMYSIDVGIRHVESFCKIESIT